MRWRVGMLSVLLTPDALVRKLKPNLLVINTYPLCFISVVTLHYRVKLKAKVINILSIN